YTNLWRVGIRSRRVLRPRSARRRVYGGARVADHLRSGPTPAPAGLPVLTSTGRDDPPLRAPPMHDRRDQSQPREYPISVAASPFILINNLDSVPVEPRCALRYDEDVDNRWRRQRFGENGGDNGG